MTSKRTLITILLMLSAFMAAESWQMFKDVHQRVDFFLFYDPTQGESNGIDLQWFVHDLGLKVSDVIKALVILRLSRLYFDIKVVGIAYLSYTVIDLGFYFLCYNTWSYVLVYLLTFGIAIISWYQMKYGITFRKRQLV